MIKDTKLYESLAAFIDAVATEDQDAERVSIKDFINEKSKTILEYGDSAIKINGDDVIINGKKVGTIISDPTDMASGMFFTSLDGKKKEFDTVEDLYAFLGDVYNVAESDDSGESDSLKEDKVTDAVFKQKAGKSARAKRWADVRKTKQQDGKAGDYESSDTSEYDDKIKGKSDKAAYSDHGTDERNKKGYYDKKDSSKEHKDPIKGGAKPAFDGGASDLDTDGSYDSHDVRPNHKDPIKG